MKRLSKKLTKKLAYLVANSFNGEHQSTRDVLRDVFGVEISFEEAVEITDMACDFHEVFNQRASGWQAEWDKTGRDRKRSSRTTENA